MADLAEELLVIAPQLADLETLQLFPHLRGIMVGLGLLMALGVVAEPAQLDLREPL